MQINSCLQFSNIVMLWRQPAQCDKICHLISTPWTFCPASASRLLVACWLATDPVCPDSQQGHRCSFAQCRILLSKYVSGRGGGRRKNIVCTSVSQSDYFTSLSVWVEGMFSHCRFQLEWHEKVVMRRCCRGSLPFSSSCYSSQVIVSYLRYLLLIKPLSH